MLFSSAIILFTSRFISKVNDPSFVGILVLLGYGLVYMNLVFIWSRRFMRRLQGPSPVPFIFTGITALPPIVWIFIYDAGLGNSFWLFAFTLLFGCALGGFFGHKAGLKAQIAFRKELEEHLNQNNKLSDDLKRPHDNLNKN